MNILRSIALAFSTFSCLPTPNVAWDKRNMRAMLASFPLVGLLVALVLWGWWAFCSALDIGQTLFAAGVTLIPILVSGKIHMDGYCDTIDALSSNATPERRREILKDPHTGAFALIGACVYILAYFALATELGRTNEMLVLLGLTQVLTRALSALCLLLFPSNGSNGLGDLFKNSSARWALATVIALFLICAAGLIAVSPISGGAMTFAAVLTGAYVYVMSKRAFGGMSGDLAGFCLQLAQLIMLGALILTEKAVAI
jgi:adenosylcobinamide-GDP ribazoletransferase